MNELLHFCRGARSAATALRDPAPIESEPLAVPAHHRVGLNDDEDLLPAGPEPAECDPEDSIDRPGPRLSLRLGVEGQLLAKGKLHDRLLPAASDQGESRAEQCRDQRQASFHGMEILRDILLRQQSDSAREPAVSFSTGRWAQDTKSKSKRTGIEDTQCQEAPQERLDQALARVKAVWIVSR